MANAILFQTPGNSSEIDFLTRRVKSLTDAIDFWNNWMLAGLVVAAIAAAWIFWSTSVVVIRSKQLVSAQVLLDSAKDRQLQADLKEKDLEIRRLNMKADTAEGGIASAQADAAKANLLAEQERLARVKIEKQLAPRSLSHSDVDAIAAKLSKFAEEFSRRKVAISSYSADADGIVFSEEIWNILKQAGIPTDPAIGRLIPVGLVDMGLKVTGPIADQEFMKTLAFGIKEKCDTDIRVEWDDKYKEVAIFVGEKPVAGLPAIICQGRSDRRPLGRRTGEPRGRIKRVVSAEKGLWSVAEEAFLRRGAFEGQWSAGGFLLRRLCLRR